MTTVGSLRRQLLAIREQVGRPSDPKHWMLLLEDGEGIPPHVSAQFSPQDSVTIRYYPRGYLVKNSERTGAWEPSIGYVMEQGKRKRVTCLYRSGKVLKVT